jgi:hypothetical protein
MLRFIFKKTIGVARIAFRVKAAVFIFPAAFVFLIHEIGESAVKAIPTG